MLKNSNSILTIQISLFRLKQGLFIFCYSGVIWSSKGISQLPFLPFFISPSVALPLGSQVSEDPLKTNIGYVKSPWRICIYLLLFSTSYMLHCPQKSIIFHFILSDMMKIIGCERLIFVVLNSISFFSLFCLCQKMLNIFFFYFITGMDQKTLKICLCSTATYPGNVNQLLSQLYQINLMLYLQCPVSPGWIECFSALKSAIFSCLRLKKLW